MAAVAVAASASAALKAADAEQGDWRTHAEQFCSPLASIHSGNIQALCLAWFLDLPGQRTLHATLCESHLALHWGAFNAVVRGGALAAAGMPKFDHLSEQEVRTIYVLVSSTSRS